MKKIFYLLLLLIPTMLSAQVKVGNNPTVIDPNAILEMESTNKGMLLPRLTATQRDAIGNPTNSMLIYNTTEGCLNMYNTSQSKWKSMCGDESSGSATFTTDCSTLAVSGTYTTGVLLDPASNYITISVNVTQLGTYNILSTGGGMYFAAAGTFTTMGVQDVVLKGQGYPSTAGANFLALSINNQLCSAVINVSNGVATITGCGTTGTFNGNIYTNIPISANTVYQSYTAGPAYTGGGVYGITSSPVNGIRISSPLNGNFTSSGAPIDYILTGTALVPGSTTINYTINGYACSFTVPIQSGPGQASAVTCSGTLSGTYQVGAAMTAGNTKVVTLTVSTIGTFNLRTATVNGVYFAGSATASATGALNITLTAVGTPIVASTGSGDAFTVNVSNSSTTFTNCTFNVVVSTPSTVPDYSTLNCASTSASVSYIKANNAEIYDVFGGYHKWEEFHFGKQTKMSADGLTLAVGAIGEDGDISGGAINSTNNNNMAEAGAVYIYNRTSLTTNWVFQAKLKASNAGAGDRFGTSIDLSNNGNTLVVGANWESGSGTGVNPASNNSAYQAGAAYVFSRSGSTWSQQAYLKASETTTYDLFGSNVAISGDGNTIAVGSIGEDGSNSGINPTVNNSIESTGAVYTYTRSGAVWSFEAYIKASNPGDRDNFGTDVSLNDDGTTLAVGSRYEDGSNSGINPVANNSAGDAGAVYIFQKTSGTWAQQAYLKAGNAGAGDLFGYSVDLDGSGNNLVVGAPYEDGNGTGINPGVNESASNAGAAYIFNRSGSTWSQQAYVKATNTSANDEFGMSATISNNGAFVAVGGWREDGTNSCINPTDNNSGTDRGAAYLYSYVSGSWLSSFTYKMPTVVGTDNTDMFGGCVSLSMDGRSIGIGAYGEAGSGTGVNPTPNNSAYQSGCVIVYTK